MIRWSVYYVIGYGENINIPTIDVTPRDLVHRKSRRTYADLQEPMS